MNIHCLPSKVCAKLADVAFDPDSLLIVRANGTVEGEAGEAYVMAVTNGVLIVSRALGNAEYSARAISYDAVSAMAIRQEGYNVYLDVTVVDKTYQIRFPSYADDALMPLVERWADATRTEPTPTATSAMPPVALSPSVALAAGMLYAASVDQDLSEHEHNYILEIGKSNTTVLREAQTYCDGHSFEQFLADIAYLDQQQRLCLLANMMEIAMKDGVLHASEQELLERFGIALQIDEANVQALRDVLLIKNQTSVLA